MKFHHYSDTAIQSFVKNGFAIYSRVIDESTLNECRRAIIPAYTALAGKHVKADVQMHAIEILEKFQRTELFDRLVSNPKTLTIMEKLLGPDICLLGYDALWINVPKDTDPVLLKGIHNDYWTGTSANTVFAKVFFTDCDAYNGITVYPGSHLQGLLPVRNRQLDTDATFKGVNLKQIKAGDLLIWHPLTLHATTGHSDSRTRISMTSRYSSTETAFSSQERALGYRTLKVGPLNTVLRLIGNDALTPLRTYGGFVGVDRRMKNLYPYGSYKDNK